MLPVRIWNRKAARMALVVTLGCAAFALLLFGCQRRLIYLPRRYAPQELRAAGTRVLSLHYETNAGRQVAYYVRPAGEGSDPAPAPSPSSPQSQRTSAADKLPNAAADTSVPDFIWIALGGNAARALDWSDFLEKVPDSRTGFLLVDYPGYGECDGRPTRKSIRDSSQAAFRSLLEHFNAEPRDFARRIGLIGHSLGAAAALDLAVDLQAPDAPPPKALGVADVPAPTVARIVLISPFTSLMAMARRTVGWPLCQLLLDRYNNIARLADLSRSDSRPSVTIIHGADDDIIPFSMGRALASAHPDWIRFIPIKGGDHNWILTSAEAEITGAMKERVSK